MQRDFQIAIVGGGLAGLTAALSLTKLGFEIAVVSPSPPPGYIDNRTSALLPASVRFLQSLDLWTEIEDKAQPFWTMRLIDDSAATRGAGAVTDFTSQEVGNEPLAYNVPNAALQQALLKKLADTGVTFVNAALLQTECSDRRTIKLSNGETVTSDLVIAADGRHSLCRKQSGIYCHQVFGGQFAVTAQLKHSKPHEAISTEFQRRGGPFTLVPMKGDQTSIVWIEPEETGAKLAQLSKQELTIQIQRRTRGHLGSIELLSKPQGFPIQSQVAQKFYAPRLALIAEAAHVLPPTGAQGLNLSLTDVATLADILSIEMAQSEDLGDEAGLALYETRRLPDVLARFGFSNGLNFLTAAQTSFGQGVRKAGLSLLRSAPPVKRQLMKLGLQPVGYIPMTMRL